MSDDPSDSDRFADSPVSRRRFVQLSAATGAALAFPGNATADASAAAFTDEYEYVLTHTPEDHATPTLVRFSDPSGPDAMAEAVDGEVVTTRDPEPAAYAQLSATQAEQIAAIPAASEFQFAPGSNPFWRLGYYPFGVFPEPTRSVDYVGFEQLKDGLREIEDRHPDRVRVRNVGQSPGHTNAVTSRPDPKGMYVAEVTNFDSDADFEEKEKVFFSCSLHGPERAGAEAGARVVENVARGSEPDIQGSDAKIEPLLDDVVVVMGFTNPDGWVARNPQYESSWQFDVPGVPGAPLYERGNAEVYDTNRQYPSVGYIIPPPTHYPAEPAAGTDAPDYVHEKVPDAKALVEHFRGYSNLNYGADLHGGPVFNEFVLGLISQDQFDTRDLHELYEMCLNIDDTLEQALTIWTTLGDAKLRLLGEQNVDPGALYGVTPEEAFDYGTIYDTIGYTVSGAFLDWMAHPEITDDEGNVVGGGLGMTTLDFEMSFSWAVNGQYYNPELVRQEVIGYRTAIRVITDFAFRNTDTPSPGSTNEFEARTVTDGEDVAYVTTGKGALARDSDDLVFTSYESVQDIQFSGVMGPGATGPAARTSEHTFTADPEGDRIEVTATWNVNSTQDNELLLEDAEGEVIARSTSPGGPESITKSITGGAEYTLVIKTYANVASRYEISGSVREATTDGSGSTTDDGSTSGGSTMVSGTEISEQVAASGEATATYTVTEDLHSLTVQTRAPSAVFDLELVAPDGEVVYEFDGVTEERVGGKDFDFPEWVVSDPQLGTWTLRVTNKLDASRPFEGHFGTLQSGSGATLPDPEQVVGYEQRPYEVTPFQFFEDYAASLAENDEGEKIGSVEPVTINEVATGDALDEYDHAVVVHDYLDEELARASSGAQANNYTRALDEFVEGDGNLVLTDTGTYVLPLLDNDLVDGSAFGDGDVTRTFHNVAQFATKNLDHPLFGTEGDVRPIQDQLWKVAPLGYAITGDAPMDVVDESAFARAAKEGVPSVAGRADGRVAAGSISRSETDGRGVHVISSLLPPASQDNLHPFGLLDYTPSFLGYVMLTSALGFEQVRVAGDTERRYGRGDHWAVEGIDAPAPEFSADGSRSSDGQVETGGGTHRVDITVDTISGDVDAGTTVDLTDAVPDGWDVATDFGDVVTTRDDGTTVVLGVRENDTVRKPTVEEAEGTEFTYYASAPRGTTETGQYTFGPAEATVTIERTPVSDDVTASNDVYVLGVSTEAN